jgi:hypothetical protein
MWVRDRANGHLFISPQPGTHPLPESPRLLARFRAAAPANSKLAPGETRRTNSEGFRKRAAGLRSKLSGAKFLRSALSACEMRKDPSCGMQRALGALTLLALFGFLL